MNDGTKSPTEQAIFEELERLLQQRLPSDWTATVERDPEFDTSSARYRPDGILRVTTPRGDTLAFVIETRLTFYPRDARWMDSPPSWMEYQLRILNAASSQIGSQSPARGWSRPAPSASGVVLVSRFLNPRTRQMLREFGVSYMDATGNLRLQAQDPPMLIELSGADTNPWPTNRPQQSLKGSGTARVVRALLDFAPPYTLRDLAQTAGLPLGTTSRVVAYLAEEAVVMREGRGPIMEVAWRQLLRLWAQDSALLQYNEAQFFLDPRGPESVTRRLADLQLDCALTGSSAASRKVAYAPPALVSIYVRSISRSAESLGLRPAPSGGNVLLIAPASDVAFERTERDGKLTYAATSQVAADLLGLPGRAPSEAEALMDWMEDNVSAWRRS